ncbi:tripartite motif-containing protein 2-like [Anneissia japonica]|uniref:tripartite motif-containing protein 2-like n=1 Tax=Anneissia japonica TaxID=1529436 RepID=UPI001425BA35|nr:tripartite motif-containing protein 2-like [Anneissia japonica]
MSVLEALQFMDKKDLECAICLSRFHQPKTLKCMHTYCLQCIQKEVETHGKMKCPICGQEHGLTNEDVKQLTSNTMTSNLLEYVMKTEDQKPTNCSFCDNQPAYHCSTCQLYLCGAQCLKQHKAVPSTKDHTLYTLDIMEEQDNSLNIHTKCPAHCNTTLEFYCSTCNKSACKKCEQTNHCYQKEHKVMLMSTAVDEFNKEASEVVKLANEVENILTERLEFIAKGRSVHDSQLNLCRIAIGIQEKKLIKKVQEKSKDLMSNIDEIHKQMNKNNNTEVKDIDLRLKQVNNVISLINSVLNKPEQRQNIGCYKTIINAVREEVLGTDFQKLFHKESIIPNFIPSTHMDDLMNTEGIGKITTANGIYKVAEGGKEISVTKGQSFVVEVCSLAESDEYKLEALLINSDEELETEVEYQGREEYKITGSCNLEGDWQMKITAGVAHIKGSPVNIKVETLGLVHTIDNISDYKEHNKTERVTDVALDTDGCILVSSNSKDILKFDQSGSFVARIEVPVPQDVKVYTMHPVGNGQMLYGDSLEKCVVMCDDKFQKIRSFGKGMLKIPKGLTVNKVTRVLYVVDYDAHCIYKFNVDDGRLLGKIGSMGSRVGQMLQPIHVALNKKGHVFVSDTGNKRIQLFDTNDKFIRILEPKRVKSNLAIKCRRNSKPLFVSDSNSSEVDDDSIEVSEPLAVTIDFDENILVSSFNHKLQLFDKDGGFIKQIDIEDDGVDFPCGITAICDRPRRVAVANHKANNINIFNY